ncbi:MAG: L-threonylcarbamoyladenylate synthase [Candidatus Woesearchaeota archaeon]
MSNYINTKIFTKENIHDAAKLIQEGEVVAFPTETVYGLGASATNKLAISKIFSAKQRPQDNPLIVHVSNTAQVDVLSHINENAKTLISKFWPGPLTIILPKKDIVPYSVTGGLETVAIRMPNHKLALEFITLSDVPIAAPSANISGRPSSTSFEHVYEDLNGRISGIIKGDTPSIGLESSVVDLTTNPPLLLRPGGISFEELKQTIPEIKLHKGSADTVKSPGMKYKHYSPRAKVILFEENSGKKIQEYASKLNEDGKIVQIIKLENNINCAQNLFKLFRDADLKGIEYILIKAINEEHIGLAIMNRVRKAASKIIN